MALTQIIHELAEQHFLAMADTRCAHMLKDVVQERTRKGIALGAPCNNPIGGKRGHSI